MRIGAESPQGRDIPTRNHGPHPRPRLPGFAVGQNAFQRAMARVKDGALSFSVPHHWPARSGLACRSKPGSRRRSPRAKPFPSSRGQEAGCKGKNVSASLFQPCCIRNIEGLLASGRVRPEQRVRAHRPGPMHHCPILFLSRLVVRLRKADIPYVLERLRGRVRQVVVQRRPGKGLTHTVAVAFRNLDPTEDPR
jgi:hypothetical protein